MRGPLGRIESRMRLVNFELRGANHTVELLALGLNWDLHNWADFIGLEFRPDNSLVMRWTAPSMENPWGDLNNNHAGCALVFRDLRLLRLGARDKDTLEPDDRTLAGISKVEPGEGPYRQRYEWDPADPFDLLFEFQSGRTLEIAAEEVEFTLAGAAA
jgi:hypothetical protein